MLEINEEEMFKLDWDYLQAKQKHFDRFLTYLKTTQSFEKLTEFKLALVIQSGSGHSGEIDLGKSSASQRESSFWTSVSKSDN